MSFPSPTFGNTWTTSEFKNKECEYKAHKGITGHTHLHTHSIFIVIGFKEKHFSVLLLTKSSRHGKETALIDHVRLSGNYSFKQEPCTFCIYLYIVHLHEDTNMWRTWLGNTCVQACRGLKYREWSLSEKATLSPPLSLSCMCEEDLKYRSKTPIRCADTGVRAQQRFI